MTTIGIDIGGTKVHGVRLDGGVVVAELTHPKPADGLLSPSVFDVVRDLWTDGVRAIGAGIAGLVADGVFVWGPHVKGTRLPIADILRSEFGVPAIVDNDANTAAYGELHLGAGRGCTEMLLITVGTGIGGAIVSNGALMRGANGFAGEWGHVTVDPDGIACACGRRGCWETLVSGPALQRGADAHDVGSRLGRGVAALVALFDPELVVVGGGVSGLGDALLEPARNELAAHLHGRPHREPPPIVRAELGPAANAIGAALMAAHSS